MRRGTLSDDDTLRLYEAGESLLALCVHEGMTPHGMIGRVGRARRQRGYTIARPSETTIIDSIEGVERAVRALNRAVRALHRQHARQAA